ncbi:hypothetical protein ACFLQJ_01000, partial [Calditrichota bacterium]
MRFKSILFLATGCLLLFNLSYAGKSHNQELTPGAFKNAIKHAESIDQAEEIAKKFATGSSDIDVVRMAQDEWANINYDEAISFFQKNYQK